MIYLYLFGTCFHFIYVFMIIGNKKKLLRDNWRILVRNLQQTFQNNNKLT